MCGIVGFVTTKPAFNGEQTKRFLKEALIFDTVRGEDSTGLISVSNQFKVDTVKSVQPGYRFVHSKQYQQRPQNAWAVVGHNRAATFGSITQKNAHPFVTKHVALVHNGTLSNKGRNLPSQNDKLEVDSAVIAHNLNAAKPEDAGKVLEMLDGSFALVWTDSRDESLNIVRNHGRPFHLGMNTQKTIMMFMSDCHMLNAISRRIDRGKGSYLKGIYSLEQFQMLKFKKGSLTPEVTEISPFVAPRTPNRGSGSGYYNNNSPKWRRDQWVRDSGKKNAGGKKSPAGRRTGTGSNVIPFRGANNLPDPERLADFMLGNTDLKPHMRVKFTPESWVAYGRDTGQGMAVGSIEHPIWECDLEAIIPNVNEKFADTLYGTAWTVRPRAQTNSTMENGNTIAIICKIASFRWTEPVVVPEAKIEVITEEELNLSMTGPHGAMVSRLRWEELTKTGCHWCGGDIDPRDHEETIWSGEMSNQPICLGCSTSPDYTGVPV